MPIINPMWFYWIQVVNNIQITAYHCFMFGVISLLVLSTCYFLYDEEDEEDEEEYEVYILKLTKLRRMIKINIFVIILCSLFAIFIPSKQTLTYMLISKNITYERVEQGERKIKELVDYIIEKTNND